MGIPFPLLDKGTGAGRSVSVIVDSDGPTGLPVAVRGGVGIAGVANLVGVGAVDVPPDLEGGVGAIGKERLLGP